MLTIGMVFGGVSPEHEVSVISTLQAAAALDRNKYRPVALYIAKDGRWYTGEPLLDLANFTDLDALLKQATPCGIDPTASSQLKVVPLRKRRFSFGSDVRLVDVVFLGLHGGAGENGGLQGLCESMSVPYTGSGVFGSAMGMDKVLSKMMCRDQGIPVVDFVALRESGWAGQEEAGLNECERTLGYPVIVKPARLGSSIGIAKASTREELDFAVEEAFRYDDKIVVEHAITNLTEVNCSVLGDPDNAEASILEQPVSASVDEVLSFTDKYVRGSDSKQSGVKRTSDGPGGMASLGRIIPAPLSDSLTEQIRQLATRVFRLFECAGVARIDFMIDNDTGDVFFNEINTIPGSFSFYLWEPSGVPFAELLDRMISIAKQRHFDQGRHIRTYDVNLLSEKSISGLKGAKSSGN